MQVAIPADDTLKIIEIQRVMAGFLEKRLLRCPLPIPDGPTIGHLTRRSAPGCTVVPDSVYTPAAHNSSLRTQGSKKQHAKV
jgi:hypothetical protein